MINYFVRFFSVWMAISCMAGEDPLFERVVNRYGFSNWCGVVRQSYVRTLQDWTLPALDLPTNGLAISSSFERFNSYRALCVKNEDAREIWLMVRANIVPSVVMAQEFLLGEFATMETTVSYSSCTNTIGDRGYTIPRGILFTRNNLCVSVRSFTNVLSPESIARQIDADILSKSIRREE